MFFIIILLFFFSLHEKYVALHVSTAPCLGDIKILGSNLFKDSTIFLPHWHILYVYINDKTNPLAMSDLLYIRVYYLLLYLKKEKLLLFS